MRHDYITRAKHFIHMIEPFLRNGNLADPALAEKAIDSFNRTNSRRVVVRHGLTRIVFLSSDYVVKVDYGDQLCLFGGCENEVHLYELARRDGFAHLFAPITPFFYNGIKWYIMPRIRNIGRYDSSAIEWVRWDESEWLEVHVNDLHQYNYGWVNNHPVIFDYACETRESALSQ